MERVFKLRSNTCICIFIVSFEKTCKKLDFVLHHGFQTPRNKWKQSAYCLVFSSVSRCLEPMMKHLPSFLTYYFKHSMIANITAFLFFISFHFLFLLDRWQVKVHVSVKFPAEVDSLWMYIFKRFDADCKNYHSLAHPKKVSRLQENIFGGLKKKTLWSSVNVLSRNQNVWWSQNVWSRTRLKF